MITEKEKQFLEMTVFQPSNFNFDKLDFTKTWEEQKLEDGTTWWSFGEAKDYDWKGSGKVWSGLCSSLEKKGLISTMEDEESVPPFKTFIWLAINEKQFNNIKQEFGL